MSSFLCFGNHRFPLPAAFAAENNILYRSGVPIAVITPSCIVEFENNSNVFYLHGPKGRARIQETLLLPALVATGSLCVGRNSEVLAVGNLLSSDASSRTCSYLLTILSRCDEVLAVFDRLAESHVAVIGCGGIGSIAATMIGSLALASLSLFDPDRIEASNFNRQLFWSRDDIGRHKVAALAEHIKSRFPLLRIEQNPCALSPADFDDAFEACTAIVFSADEPIGLATSVREWTKSRKISAVFCGYHMSTCILSGANLPTSHHKREFRQIEGSISPSYGPTNAVIGGLAVDSLILQIAGIEDGSNFSELRLKELKNHQPG